MQILLFLNTSLFTGNGRSKQWEKRKKYTKQTIYKISSSDITHSLRIKLSFRCASCSLGILKLNINWHSETIFFYYHSCYYYYYYYRINKLKQWMKQKLNWDLTKITVTGSRRHALRSKPADLFRKLRPDSESTFWRSTHLFVGVVTLIIYLLPIGQTCC